MIIQANDTISHRFLRDSTKLWVHSVFSFSQSWFCIRLFRLNSTDKQQFPICTWYITKLLHKNINRNPYYYWTWFCGQIILHPYVEHVLAGNIMCVCVFCALEIFSISLNAARDIHARTNIFLSDFFFLPVACSHFYFHAMLRPFLSALPLAFVWRVCILLFDENTVCLLALSANNALVKDWSLLPCYFGRLQRRHTSVRSNRQRKGVRGEFKIQADDMERVQHSHISGTFDWMQQNFENNTDEFVQYLIVSKNVLKKQPTAVQNNVVVTIWEYIWHSVVCCDLCLFFAM